MVTRLPRPRVVTCLLCTIIREQSVRGKERYPGRAQCACARTEHTPGRDFASARAGVYASISL